MTTDRRRKPWLWPALVPIETDAIPAYRPDSRLISGGYNRPPKPSIPKRKDSMPHDHDFDPVSGWCGRCGLRDDGRLINYTGKILRPGPTELETNVGTTQHTSTNRPEETP